MGCKFINTKTPKLCAGTKKHRLTFYYRTITSPADVDFDIDLDVSFKVWGALKTTSGVIVFDSMNIERVPTHKFYIDYRADITQELDLEFKSKRYDIIKVNNINEDDSVLELLCSLKGSVDNKASLI